MLFAARMSPSGKTREALGSFESDGIKIHTARDAILCYSQQECLHQVRRGRLWEALSPVALRYIQQEMLFAARMSPSGKTREALGSFESDGIKIHTARDAILCYSQQECLHQVRRGRLWEALSPMALRCIQQEMLFLFL